MPISVGTLHVKTIIEVIGYTNPHYFNLQIIGYRFQYNIFQFLTLVVCCELVLLPYMNTKYLDTEIGNMAISQT